MGQTAPASVSIEPLTPERIDEFLAFFDHERGPAFADNPEWAKCYYKSAQILCFVIHPQWRRRGVARAVLDAACAAFARRGIAMVEAYPFRSGDGDDPGDHYHGPLPMFLNAGFAVAGDTPNMTIVRKLLVPA